MARWVQMADGYDEYDGYDGRPCRYELRAYERKTSSSPPLLHPPALPAYHFISSLSLSFSLLLLLFIFLYRSQTSRSNSTFAQHLFALLHGIFASFLHSFFCRVRATIRFCSPGGETTLLIASWIAHSRPYPLLFTGTSQDDGIVRQDNQFNLY